LLNASARNVIGANLENNLHLLGGVRWRAQVLKRYFDVAAKPTIAPFLVLLGRRGLAATRSPIMP
jgi:hypothetical protein